RQRYPQFAILPHIWEKEEVSYADCIKGDYRQMQRYSKINLTCRITKEQGILYTWVDTCCIDKSSSAELSEAINSMFRWYQEAKVCYAYLSDLSPGTDWNEFIWLLHLAHHRITRGWTLQELIAPCHVVFFDSVWDTTIEPQQRNRTNLASLLSDITSIDKTLLDGRCSLNDSYCIARKMSWAARRETIRSEDKVYCLLGLCNINMPLLYREGEKAFVRLQEEIMRSTADVSIL
ncbi:hypothetical protein BU25DRAFT_306515, partial [Macroventuria anomochaeta]